MANFDESKCTVIEAVIPGGNKYTSSEKLWIDNETIKPVKLVIYDREEQEKYILEFSEFEYNAEFEEGTFDIPKSAE